MDQTKLKQLIAKSFKTRNVYLTTEGQKRDRKDLINRKRKYIIDCIQQLRNLEKV